MGPCSGKISPFKNRCVCVYVEVGGVSLMCPEYRGLWLGERESVLPMFLSLSSLGLGEGVDSRTQSGEPSI